jgi:hypothetical protein
METFLRRERSGGTRLERPCERPHVTSNLPDDDFLLRANSGKGADVDNRDAEDRRRYSQRSTRER